MQYRNARLGALCLALPLAAFATAPRGAIRVRAAANRPAGDTVIVAGLPYAPYAGTTLRLSAALVHNGTPLSPADAPVTWESDRARVAWVSNDGVLTLLEPGEATITAHAGLLRTAMRLVVRRNPAARVALSLEAAAGSPGGGVRLVARVSDASGGDVGDARVNLAVSARGLPLAGSAVIAEDGRFAADRPGLYTIIASIGGVADRVTLLVAPPAGSAPAAAAPAGRVRGITIADVPYQAYAGTSFPLVADVRLDRATAPGAAPPVSWSSSNTDVALVDQNGMVAFRAPGRVTITAEMGGRRDMKHFIVRQVPAIRMAFTVNARDIRVGDAVKLREEVWGPGGTPIRDARVNYAVVAHGKPTSAAATISEDRVFVADAPGVYTIIAELGGRAEQTTVFVRPGDVARSGSGR